MDLVLPIERAPCCVCIYAFADNAFDVYIFYAVLFLEMFLFLQWNKD